MRLTVSEKSALPTSFTKAIFMGIYFHLKNKWLQKILFDVIFGDI